MPRYINSLKIASFNSKITNHFLSRFEMVRLKNKISLQATGGREILKKNTILRSPHVNKKARDQIQVVHINRFFFPTNSFNWFAFLKMYHRYKTDEIEFDYKFYQELNYFVVFSN